MRKKAKLKELLLDLCRVQMELRLVGIAEDEPLKNKDKICVLLKDMRDLTSGKGTWLTSDTEPVIKKRKYTTKRSGRKERKDSVRC